MCVYLDMPNIFFVFKKEPESKIENFVQWCAGPMVHVDVVMGDSQIMFTSFMFEKFSMNRAVGYHKNTHECLSLNVSQEVHDSAQEMLLRLVQKKIPYNYYDVFHLLVPSMMSKIDVVQEEEIQSLFCSQAATLLLKMILVPEHELLQQVNQLNSRLTTPTMLYNTIKPYCEESVALFDI